ncbi:MAG: hypothetical protein RR977_00390, partial [Oscillospiraceae bacterium]
ILSVLLVIALIGLGIFFFRWYGKKAPQPSVSARGMFEWRESTVEDPKSVQSLIQDLKITKWYQEIPEDWNHVSDFSSSLHKQGVSIYALFGAVEWGYERDGITLISHLKQVTDYNKTAPKNARIDGVMIDVEPYISSKWKKNKKKNMKIYVDGMLKAYQSVAGQHLQFAICIPRHYDDQGLSEELERLIAKGCDEVAVMNYDCGNEVEKIQTEAILAQKYGKELHCVLEFQEVGKHGLVEEKTYRNKGLEAAWNAWETVDAAYPKIPVTWDYHCTNPLLEMVENKSSK